MNDSSVKPCFIVLPGFAPDALPIAPLKERLERDGYPVIASNFWGHRTIRDFSTLTIAQCLEGVRELVEEAKIKSPVVAGIGVSLGGALLLEHAKSHDDVNSIISIGTPFRLKKRPLFRTIAALAPYVHPVWRILDNVKALRLPPLGVSPAVFDYLEGDFLRGLENIKASVVFLHSKLDTVTDYRVVTSYAERLSSARKHVAVLSNGDHVINYDADVIMKYV